MLEVNSFVIDQYFEKESLKHQGNVRLEEVERDETERYICTRQVKNLGKCVINYIYEAFLEENGRESLVRIADQNPLYAPKPRYSIRGVREKEKFYVYQAVNTFSDGQFGRLDYSFHYQYQLSENNLISLETSYRIGKELGSLKSAIVTWQKQKEQNTSQGSLEFVLEKPNWQLRFENSKTHCVILPENLQFFMPDLQASFEMRSKNKIHELVFLSEDKEKIVFQFPYLVNIKDWDRKISSQGKDWKNLAQQFPIDIKANLV